MQSSSSMSSADQPSQSSAKALVDERKTVRDQWVSLLNLLASQVKVDVAQRAKAGTDDLECPSERPC